MKEPIRSAMTCIFGGLAVAVRQDIAAQFVSEWTGDEGQLLTNPTREHVHHLCLA